MYCDKFGVLQCSVQKYIFVRSTKLKSTLCRVLEFHPCNARPEPAPTNTTCEDFATLCRVKIWPFYRAALGWRLKSVDISHFLRPREVWKLLQISTYWKISAALNICKMSHSAETCFEFYIILVIINMLFVVVEILAQVVHISYFQTSYIFEKKCLPVQCFPFLVSPVAVQHWLFKRIVTTPIIYLIFWGSLTLVEFFLDSHNLIKHIYGQF